MFKIQDAQRLQRNDDNLVALEKKVTGEYLEVLKQEEVFLKQKSRMQWLELGDQNNKFFHWSIMARRNKNHMKRIVSKENVVIEDEGEIRDEAERYFKNIMGSVTRTSDITMQWEVDSAE